MTLLGKTVKYTWHDDPLGIVVAVEFAKHRFMVLVQKIDGTLVEYGATELQVL